MKPEVIFVGSRYGNTDDTRTRGRVMLSRYHFRHNASCVVWLKSPIDPQTEPPLANDTPAIPKPRADIRVSLREAHLAGT